jgi:hypothetical protein
MATELWGPIDWEGDIDDLGFRVWSIKWLIRADTADGPANVMRTDELPIAGDPWVIFADEDDWAFFTQRMSARRYKPKDGEKHRWWEVSQWATNRPQKRCNEFQIEDPLLEPPKIGGSFIKYTQEATHDRFGNQITTSSHEIIRGSQVEFDESRHSIRIEQNVPDLEADIWSPMQDCVNDEIIWGFPARCVKLSQVTWERNYYGACTVYYTRIFDFEVWVKTDPKTGLVRSGFDRDILDEGTKALMGHWGTPSGETVRRWVLDPIDGQDPNPANPAHFARVLDPKGNPISVILNGKGQPVDLSASGAVDDASKQNPCKITSAGHGLESGDIVAITGVKGSTVASGFDTIPKKHPANGIFTVVKVDANNFTLTGCNNSLANVDYVDGTGRWVNLTVEGPGNIHVEKYNEANFLDLDIPTDL